MQHSLVVVEGVHDAAFLGHLLIANGFRAIDNIVDVPDIWRDLIPKIFPDGSKLKHVVSYPDIYINAVGREQTVAIKVAGDVSILIEELQASLEILNVSEIYSIAIVADADDIGSNARFDYVKNLLHAMNESVDPRSVRGFPLVVPTDLDKFGGGAPRVGVFILPDNQRAGTLETLLCEFSAERFPLIDSAVKALIYEVDKTVPITEKYLKSFRKGAGKSKAHVSIVGNFLSPGSSLAVSLTKSDWLPTKNNEKIAPVNGFIKALFE
ncbi:DUF3226 domain-containing protein [Allorhizobium taibaishanense]|uniref:Uncharacterized protein n=1 Tax=Allorhizobium taibaishanense TaxID=887144 RepID=A0A1Q8ZZM8_9HYPH|nr:DUF3226 domain-containing protein [Allorhizobium taibaishanense]MBB4007230.1 hypothetical protein [Allorhizobium taibaishanense]OLP47764.1 hypothetical protein BJF91_05200 [Allorhizobium taibaishanense]